MMKFDVSITIDYNPHYSKRFASAVVWCRENIGCRNNLWYAPGPICNLVQFSFNEEKDAVLFALKWL